MAPLDNGFLITDPDQQPGVVFEVPNGIEPEGLPEDGYYSEKMVRCSFCKQRQKHRKGFFAILPDSTKALCGHCCAVQLTSKATVAKIERTTERKIEVVRQRQISKALLQDVDELLDLLETNFVPVSHDIEWNFAELRYIFASQPLKLEYKLGYALGGFRSIANACEEKLTDAKVEQLLQKRQKSMEVVSLALDAMEKAVSLLSFNQLGGRIKNWGKVDGYASADVSFRKGRLVAGKRQTYLGEYDFWESTVDLRPVEMPQCIRLYEIISGSGASGK